MRVVLNRSTLFQGGASFVDPFCHLCFMFVFVMLSYLFLAALWSPFGKRTDLLALLCVVFSSVFVTVWYLGSSVVLDCIDS